MYKRILVCLENSGTDAHIVEHVGPLAKLCGASVLLIHVADGWAARNIKQLDLRESEEMREDRAYLERTALEMRERHGLTVSSVLALGDPPREILRLSEESRCDLIAMTTHGHRLIGDILFGSTIDYVRHRSKTPLLIVSPKTS